MAADARIHNFPSGFFLNDVPHDIQVDDERLHFIVDTGNNTKKKGIDPIIIALKAIVCVKIPESQSKATNAKTRVVIHYVTPRKNSVLRVVDLSLTTEDITQAQDLCKVLQEKLKKQVKRPKHLLVFVNPRSGGSRGQAIYKKHALPLFVIAGIQTTVIVTEKAGQIKEKLQTDNISQFDGVVLVGGDGTFNEAVQGLLLQKAKEDGKDVSDPLVTLTPSDLRIGLIPAGTGQGMVRLSCNTNDIETSVIRIIIGDHFSISTYTCHNGGRLLGIGNLLSAYGSISKAISDSEENRWLGRARYGWAVGKVVAKPCNVNVEMHMNLAPDVPDNMHHTEKEVQETEKDAVIVKPATYFDVNLYFNDFVKYEWSLDYFNVYAVDTCKLKNRLKYFHSMARSINMLDLGCVSMYKATSLHLIAHWADNPPARMRSQSGQSLSDEASANNLSPTDFLNIVNLDGEAAHMTSNVIDYRVQPRTIQMFGVMSESISFT